MKHQLTSFKMACYDAAAQISNGSLLHDCTERHMPHLGLCDRVLKACLAGNVSKQTLIQAVTAEPPAAAYLTLWSKLQLASQSPWS